MIDVIVGVCIIYSSGTITQGSVTVNSTIDIPSLRMQRKVKSMQMFRKPVEQAMQGDRVGICVTQLDAKLFERGVVCSPGHLQLVYALILPIKRIAYFKNEIRSGAKFHVTAVHETVLAKLTLLRSVSSEEFSFGSELSYEEELPMDTAGIVGTWFGLIEFEHPVICGKRSLLLGSKLDTDVHAKACRLAFYGHTGEVFTSPDYRSNLSEVRVFKMKCKTGVVERAPNENEVIVKDLFKKETNIDLFAGMKVEFSSGERGTIQGPFGQSGKVKVQLDLGQAMSSALSRYKNKKGERSAQGLVDPEHVKVTLKFKRFIFDSNKNMVQ